MRKLVATVAVQGLMAFNMPALFSRLHQLEWYGGTLRSWVESMDLTEGATILEIGCGPGELALDMARAGYQVTATDKSEKMLNRARKNALHGVTFQNADALHLPFENDHFDAVIAASLLNVIADKNALLMQMARVTKPAGKVSVFFPTPKFTPERMMQFSKENQLDAFQSASFELWASKAPKLESTQAEKLFSAAGLKNCTSKTYLAGMLCSLTGNARASDPQV